jgi:FAD/FMN-containing dehydrogenase
VSETGVAGLALSGGVSHQRRRDGMTVDNLVSAEVVLADGRQVRASADEHPDLHWALRGGGGNFGVVTSFELRLHELGPEVSRSTSPTRSRTPRVLAGWRDAVPAPRRALDRRADLVAARRRGAARGAARPAVRRRGRHVGGRPGGGRARHAARARAGTPLLDMSGPVAYLDFQARWTRTSPRAAPLLEGAVPRRALRRRHRPHRRLVERARRPDTLVIVRHCGGAIARVGAGETAFGDRSSEWMLSIDSTWDDAAGDAANLEYTRAFWDAALPFSDGKTYFNFPGLLEEGDAAVRDSYGPNHARLARIKAAYDPENVFRLNQNIRPAGS